MLGETLFDPDGVEAEPGAQSAGLGLLPVKTTFTGDKHTVQVQATLQCDINPFTPLKGSPIRGYEIHMGRSRPTGDVSRLCRVELASNSHFDGMVSDNGRIWGSYLHGLFDNNAFRHAWLRSLGWQDTGQIFDREQAYNRLADHTRAHLDMKALREIIWND